MFGLIKKMNMRLLITTVNAYLFMQNAYRWAMRNILFNLLLLSCMLINTVKPFTTIHLRLN